MDDISEVLNDNISSLLREKYKNNFKIENIKCIKVSMKHMNYLAKVKIGNEEKTHDFTCITMENPYIPILFDGELTKAGKAREQYWAEFGEFLSEIY